MYGGIRQKWVSLANDTNGHGHVHERLTTPNRTQLRSFWSRSDTDKTKQNETTKYTTQYNSINLWPNFRKIV